GYQVEGVNRLAQMLIATRGALLADEMGLGKSAQALITATYFTNTVLIVCPAMVVRHWRAQAQRWAPQLYVDVLGYETFRNLVAKGELPCKVYGMLILDEIHYLSNS